MSVHGIEILYVFLTLGEVFCAQIDISDLNNTASESLPCTTDRECPETSYCFLSKKCVKCFDCTTRHRETLIRCARSIHDCGGCLPGFNSENYPHVRSYCQEILLDANVAQSRLINETVTSMNIKYLTVIGILILAVCGFVSARHISRKYRRPVLNTSDSPSTSDSPTPPTSERDSSFSTPRPPPPYREHEDIDDDNVSCSFSFHVSGQPYVEAKAVPCFTELNCSDVDHGSGAQPAENPPNNAAVLTPFTETTNQATSSAVTETSYPQYGFQIHDENTTPSFWTPGENYGITENQTAQTTIDAKVSLKRKSTDENDNPKKQKGG